MRQDRFLTGILIGILVLIVVALTLFFMRRGSQTYRTDAAPDAVVYNYVLAVNNRDYQKAYTYLADGGSKPSYEDFRRSFFNGMVMPGNVGASVGTAQVNGEEATVQLNLIYPSGDPFSSGYSNTDRALLVRQKGEWKISSMPYNFWDYNWYMTPVPKPLPPSD